MLGNVGSIASLVGVVVSLVGLGFAILQIRKLRGETRAAREASEDTRRAIGRDLAIGDVSRTFEQVEVVKQALRERQWSRSLSLLPSVRRALISIRYRNPRLVQPQADKLQVAVGFLEHVEHSIDVNREGMADEAIDGFIQGLISLQTTIAELESNLYVSDGEVD